MSLSGDESVRRILLPPLDSCSSVDARFGGGWISTIGGFSIFSSSVDDSDNFEISIDGDSSIAIVADGSVVGVIVRSGSIGVVGDTFSNDDVSIEDDGSMIVVSVGVDDRFVSTSLPKNNPIVLALSLISNYQLMPQSQSDTKATNSLAASVHD